MVIQGVSYLSDFEAKKAIIETARRLEGRGFMTAGDGSISVRVGPNAVWATVDGADKAALTQDMLVRVDLNGRGDLGPRAKPLGEDLAIHLKIYQENENVQCVLHVYPPCAEVVSRQGQGLPAASFSPSVRKLGRVDHRWSSSPGSPAKRWPKRWPPRAAPATAWCWSTTAVCSGPGPRWKPATWPKP